MTKATAQGLRNWAIINMLIWFLLGMTSKESVFELPSSQPEDSNIIEYAINKADQIKYVQGLVSPNDSLPSSNCSGACENEYRNLKYNSCTDKNDYLNDDIARLSSKRGLIGEMIRENVNAHGLIKPICTMMGMESQFGTKSNLFRECSSKGITRVTRPCINENYFKLAHNSFNLVSSCMKEFISPDASEMEQKEDVRMTYAMINKESGFHLNAASSTSSGKIGAGGIGQLVDVAITDVNNKQLNQVRRLLNASNDPQCRDISKQFLQGKNPMKASSGEACGRVALKDGNPIKNMVYTYAYLKVNKNYLESLIFKKYARKFAGLPPEEINKIKRAMMVWAHNTGIGGAATPLSSLLNGPYLKKTVTSADTFIKQMETFMRIAPNRANRSRGRLAETTNYLPKINSILNNIESNAGGGSCLN